jgi:hypothetical protein
VDLLRAPSLLRVLGGRVSGKPAGSRTGTSKSYAFTTPKRVGAAVEARSVLRSELRSHHARLSFAIPHVCELRVFAERFVTFEPRLHGQTLARLA